VDELQRGCRLVEIVCAFAIFHQYFSGIDRANAVLACPEDLFMGIDRSSEVCRGPGQGRMGILHRNFNDA